MCSFLLLLLMLLEAEGVGINVDILLSQMIPVAPNDVAFSAHAVLLTAFTLFQIAIYEVSGFD